MNLLPAVLLLVAITAAQGANDTAGSELSASNVTNGTCGAHLEKNSSKTIHHTDREIPLFPIDWRDVVGSVVAILFAAFANAGGIGGPCNITRHHESWWRVLSDAVCGRGSEFELLVHQVSLNLWWTSNPRSIY